MILQQGFDGTGHFYDIVFAQAPNISGEVSTPLLTVTVENFASQLSEIPIPVTVRNGQLIIKCAPQAPVISIALPTQSLTWPHVILNTCGNPIQVTAYEIWRDPAPYAVTAGGPIGHVTVPAGTPATAVFSFSEAPPAEGLGVYPAVAVAQGELHSTSPTRRGPSVTR